MMLLPGELGEAPPASEKNSYEHNLAEDPTNKPRRCGAEICSGTPCARYPLAGKRGCRIHGGASTGPRTLAVRAAFSAANTKHGRYKNGHARRAKEKFYRGQVKRIMREAERAGLLLNK